LTLVVGGSTTAAAADFVTTLEAAVVAAVSMYARYVHNVVTKTLSYTAAADGESGVGDLVIDLGVAVESHIEGDEAVTVALTAAASTSGVVAVVGSAGSVATIGSRIQFEDGDVLAALYSVIA
jgi:hypothetical protein